ncbi:hypothetical protein FCL40_13620 [Ferrimonas sediminicola]|uniref:Uncharacterized protein n=1 Tax=Ferrimonas sediminicola TaxID=2569538 RepID=A0A4U1BBZ1_9GAMM|nr:hypothetical protein [Ferrimonas sediminicola]TKB48163.1 hypothetical protein FCL40_13620 [Ferrimonas sediminicola]
MDNNFSDRLREAVAYRKQTRLPNVNLIISFVSLSTLAYIVLALFAIPSGTLPDYHFVNEGGAITALSAIYLAMASSFSMGALAVTIRAKDSNVWPWVIMTLGFGVLALDELLQFHERFGSVLGQYMESGMFRNWNDVIVILYGVVALLIVASILPSLIRCKMLPELFVIGFVFYGIHTFIDATQEPRTVVSAIFEESAKLLCVLFLALGSFVGFLGILWNFNPANSAVKRS